MNVAIVGSRTFTNYEYFRTWVLRTVAPPDIDYIVSGGARGTDTLGEKFAEEFDIPTIIHYPDWTQYGKRAGFIRNKLIIRDSDVVIAFWNGESKGTKSSINLAKKEGKELYIYAVP